MVDPEENARKAFALRGVGSTVEQRLLLLFPRTSRQQSECLLRIQLHWSCEGQAAIALASARDPYDGVCLQDTKKALQLDRSASLLLPFEFFVTWLMTGPCI